MAAKDIDTDLISNLSIGIVCVDAQLDVEVLNASAEAMLEASMVKAVGQNLQDLLELPDSLLMRMHETLQSGQPYTDREVSLQPVGGAPLLADCTISPWIRHKQSAGLVLEFAALDRQLRIAREEALVSHQQKTSSLLRSLAHEVKNPLGGIRGAAQLLEQELEDDSMREYTEIIIRESDRLRQLIDRMLGPANRPDLKEINIHAVLEHVRKIIRVEAPKDVALSFDYDPSIPELFSDHDRLVQVFLNIAANALNAVSSDGTITFRSRVINNFTIGSKKHKLIICVEIIDDGKGISDELRGQIFFPLVSGSANGSGLGLSIAQTTMQQLGGIIECKSEPSRTVFSVYLPLKNEVNRQHYRHHHE